jgi:hypothetical protein
MLTLYFLRLCGHGWISPVFEREYPGTGQFNFSECLECGERDVKAFLSVPNPETIARILEQWKEKHPLHFRPTHDGKLI